MQKIFLVCKIEITYYESPIGLIEIKGNDNGIQSLIILDDNTTFTFKTTPDSLTNCITQLEEYFKGTRKQFNLLLNPQGTNFQKQIWKELQNVAFGKTRTYLEQSKALGDPKAIRAVATANGKNPIWIIIPCHRIIGSDGSLTGYAGGLWRKKWLLDHESPVKQESLF